MIVGIAIFRGIWNETIEALEGYRKVYGKGTIHYARKELCRMAAQLNEDLLFVDDDMEPLPGSIEKLQAHLMAADVPIVAGIYRLRQEWRYDDGSSLFPLSVGMWDGENTQKYLTNPSRGFQKMDWVGTGFMLIRSDVCRDVAESEINPFLGDDDALSFSKWAEKRGLPLYVDWEAEAKHWDRRPLMVRRANSTGSSSKSIKSS